MPEVQIPDPETPTITFMLSGQRKVVMRQANGNDMIRAQKAAGDEASPSQQLYALLSRCISINGKAPRPEEIGRLSLGAIKKITMEFNKLNDDKPDDEVLDDGEGAPSRPPGEPA